MGQRFFLFAFNWAKKWASSLRKSDSPSSENENFLSDFEDETGAETSG